MHLIYKALIQGNISIKSSLASDEQDKLVGTENPHLSFN